MPTQGPAIGILGLAALLLTGCANYLPQYSEQETRLERQPLAGELQIDVGDPILDLPQRRICIREQKAFDVTRIEITRHYERYTPYQIWRELYEIPLGAVALIAGIGANLVNVITFGQIPEQATRGWIEDGLAGLNPFMNMKSSERSLDLLADTQEQRRSSRVEDASLPWADKPVTVILGKHSYPMQTDRNGVLRLNLLEPPFYGQDISHVEQLQVQVNGLDKRQAEATLQVSPDLQARLQEAEKLILDDLESDGVERWVFRIRRLNELSLEEEAQDLEKNLIELTRYDPELQQEFLQALRPALNPTL